MLCFILHVLFNIKENITVIVMFFTDKYNIIFLFIIASFRDVGEDVDTCAGETIIILWLLSYVQF